MSLTPLIGGQHGVVFFGPRSNPRRYRYWAERGLIHVEDSENNSYDTISVRTFLRRIRAISEMLGNSRATLAAEKFAHADEIERQQRFVEEAADLARKAQEQGMPPQLRGAFRVEHVGVKVLPTAQAAFF